MIWFSSSFSISICIYLHFALRTRHQILLLLFIFIFFSILNGASQSWTLRVALPNVTVSSTYERLFLKNNFELEYVYTVKIVTAAKATTVCCRYEKKQQKNHHIALHCMCHSHRTENKTIHKNSVNCQQ